MIDTYELGMYAFLTLAIFCGIFNVGYMIYNLESIKTVNTIPNIIIEDTGQCQINCSQCLEYCNTIIDDAMQTYIKVKGIGQTVAIREGYT